MTGPGARPRGWRFGPFELDAATGELARGEERVRLQGKPFELLVALLEARGDLVTRETLHERLWPGVIVDFETGLNAAVRRLRDALRDSAEQPRYVETVPRRGYRFIAAAEPIDRPGRAAAPALVPDADATDAHAEAPGAAARDAASARRRFMAGMAAGLTLVAVFATVFAMVIARAPAGGERRTLLVLPFETLDSEADAWLGHGLTDEMIVRLGRLDPLRLGVIARTSAERFAEARHDIAEARALLDADFVLEGSVRREAGHVRVSATLIKTSDRTQLWSESFDRETRDVLALQRDIAGRVAEALALELLPAERAGARAAPVDPAAYDATLRGRWFWNQQTPEGFRRAGEAYRTALAADSTYAPAWAGLADTYALVGVYDFLPPDDVFPLAREAARRALALDSTLAEPWTSLGIIQLAYDWDWAAAERSLRRALALNSSDGIAREWYAILLGATGRTAEALRASERALEVDPLSRIVNADRGWLLFFARRYDEAATQLLQTLHLDPHFHVAHDNLAWVYFVKGDMDGWFHHTLKALELSGESPEDLALLRARYEREGWRAWRRRSVEDMVRDAAKHYVSPYDIALEYAAIGEAEEAMRWLERSCGRREVDMIALRVDPRLDAVRHLPAFAALVDRIGFPED